ncbi:peptidase S8 [Actinophytocola sp. NPDC049390]|uniref:peptidase S8 n=1 Tax=Actinophytocola sp. NPDC049390 TaxID=3363894 RepID=UPI00378D5751
MRTRCTGRRVGAAAAAMAVLAVVGSAQAQPTRPVSDVTVTPQAVDLLAVAAGTDGTPLDLAAQAAADLRPYTAADLQDAYQLPSERLGARQTIAVVSPYDNPNAEADLATYRAANDLAPCTADFPCLRRVNQRGGSEPPPGHTGWGLNINAGLQVASAACPNCRLLLVGADSSDLADLNAAVDQAAIQGANVIVTVFGAREYPGQLADAGHYDHPGTVITAPAGDSGFGFGNTGTQLVPAAYGTVVAVGGTSLYRDTNARGWGETAMPNTGSGCSVYVPRPATQERGLCGDKRTVADVAAVADIDTPVAVYDTYGYPGWLAVSGTPLAAALIGGVYALAGNTDQADPARRLARQHRQLNDVTTGANGQCGGSYLCTAVRGYDGPTGHGTPLGIGAF